MEFDLEKVGGISKYIAEDVTLGEGDDAEEVTLYKVEAGEDSEAINRINSDEYIDEGPRVFLVIRKNTLEVRTDRKLKDLLREKYESVMESRYFGRGGIEIVNSGQLSSDEINDLVRLSYDMSKR